MPATPGTTFPSPRALHAGARLTMSALLSCLPLFGCNPYEKQVGDFNAGAVDPLKFARPYLGTGGTGKMPGMGTFTFAKAYAGGKEVLYYPLELNGRQKGLKDPLDINAIYAMGKAPLAYVFDPDGQDAAADSAKCLKPEGYVFDQQRDAVRYDRQGTVFTALPIDSDPVGTTRYAPIVSMVPVTSQTNGCQDIKSEGRLVLRTDISVPLNPPPEGIADALPSGRSNGRYLVQAIIDPAAKSIGPEPPKAGATAAFDECGPETAALCSQVKTTGLGLVRWGWFKQYLLAYIDGGAVPTQLVNNEPNKLRMVTHRLFIPTKILARTEDGMAFEEAENDAVGSGFDVLEYRRGEQGHSPLCQVYSFEPTDPSMPAKSVADIDLSKVVDLKRVVYCLQVPSN